MPPGASMKVPPGAIARVEGVGDLFEFVRTAEKARNAREIVGGGGDTGNVVAKGDGKVVLLRFAFVEGEALEDERGGSLRRFVVELDETGSGVEALDRREAESAKHDLGVLAVAE
jgi:hypothetical protein